MDSFDCSLEMEPRTLRSVQLDVAREQAANVLKRETPEDATKIFTKGMKPVEDMGREEMLGQLIQSVEGNTNVPCELYASIGDGGEGILEKIHIEEPLTAPF
ncbi:uncharacterized protein LOC116245893 [Nymphaea colorata]|nr:uncharacterized protein LOC116245893 [Nymphaea colorata]